MSVSESEPVLLWADAPGNIAIVAQRNFQTAPSPFEIEESSVARAIDSRKNEFRTGRHAARLAMGKLGLLPCAIPSGPNRAPVWPDNAVGSISHCSTTCVAAVGLRTEYLSIGIDIELNRPLPADVRSMVFSEEEVFGESQSGQRKCFDVITFSAKESVFKCLYPMVGFYFDFKEVSLIIEEESGRFSAMLPERITRETGLYSIEGTYKLTKEFVFTLTSIARDLGVKKHGKS